LDVASSLEKELVFDRLPVIFP